MRRQTRSRSLVLAVTMTFIWAGAVSAGAAPTSQAVVNGTIAAVNGNNVTVTSTDAAQKVVKVQPDTLILRRETADLGAIKSGDALGVAAKRGADGSLTAVSISIFSPELWNRARKGQWTMESGNIMTNAEVTQYVQRVEGRMLYMKYNEGTATISVPASTEIHRLVTAQVVDLKPGMRVTVRGSSDTDGTIKASNITFDRPGHS